MKEKEKLRKLVLLIGDLIKIEGNEWMVNELLNQIGDSVPVDQIASNSIIQNIHEYCVEEKIEKQAQEFYGDFPIEDIKTQLIQDYIKMEHERRRDDFKNFCLCMYQQFENIVNHLFENKVYPVWDTIRYSKVNSQSIKSVEILVLGTSKDWYANIKFKAILYYYYYLRNVENLIAFRANEDIFNELYQVRNENHRGSSKNSFQLKILAQIEGNEAKYYFKFYGFLEDFVSKVAESIKSEAQISNKSSSNESLADNPALLKLKEQLSSSP